MVNNHTHAGHLILEELTARGINPDYLTQYLNQTEGQLKQLLNGQQPITEELATGLAAAFGTSPDYWLNLQANLKNIQHP